jgi:hypothetical protein
MGGGFDREPGKHNLAREAESKPATPTISPGKRTLTEAVGVQLSASAHGATSANRTDSSTVQEAAAEGIAGGGGSLPHAETIQRLFGRHDISGIEAHVGGPAATASRAIGAEAYATGHHVAFASAPSLHTAAHETAHVVQQRGGVQLKGGVGETGDAHEQHANAVADAVVQGKSAETLLDRYASGLTSGPIQAAGIQRFDSYEHAQLGDETDKSIGGSGTAVSAAESTRRTADQSATAGGKRFDAGQRGMSMTLRTRNPANNLPATDGATRGVPFSYGEMIALSGDVYFSVDHMKMAPADEVERLRDLVHDQTLNPTGKNFDLEFQAATAWRRSGIYKPGTGEKEGTKGEYWGVGGDSYVDLAKENNAHFSQAAGAVAVASGPEGNAAPDNHQAWLTDHSRAIALATKARDAKKKAGLISSGASTPATGAAKPGDHPAPVDKAAKPGTKDASKDAAPPKDAVPPTDAAPTTTPGAPASPPVDFKALENEAYIYNAGGDHYLTDAFSAGHLVNKKALEPVTDRVMDNATFEKLIDDMTVFADKEHPYVPHGMVRSRVADGLSVFKTDANLRHNVGAKLVHDYLNEHGAVVTSKNGKFSWTTKGDDNMDATTKDIASRAVLASRNCIRSLLNDSDADLAKPENADDAWDYTPNVDASAFAAKSEPFLRAQLGQSAKLWELMQNAIKVQDQEKEEKKVEGKAAKTAKDDKHGDWGPQPGGGRFTRRMIVAEGTVTTK